MPSVSAKQARFMASAAHDPKFAADAGIPQSVAQEYNQADAGTGRIKPKKKRAPLSQAIHDAMVKHGKELPE